MDHQIYTLANGIRILLKPNSSTISHACILINTGSRDEKEGKDGLAHLIEHLLFKRTEKRNTNQILNRLELVGADLNAYTTKEYTCIHASFLNQYLERSLDLFEDLTFHSVFPEEEIEKEKGVILDEIASYLDQPEEAIQDDFEELLFKDHALGRNILGTTQSVSDLSRKDINNFIKNNYRTDEIVVGIIGHYDFKKVIKTAEKIFGAIPANLPPRERKNPTLYTPGKLIQEKPINQSHAVLGNRAYDMHHPSREALLLLNNLLGGMGMSSRLNLEIREKYGIAYTIESNYIPFSDTGLFSIYLGTDAEKMDRALKLVNRELKKLREQTLGSVQLQQAKQKFIGQIALAEENRMSLIISLSKTLVDYGSIDPLEVLFAKINKVSAPQLLAIANEIFDPQQISSLIFEPQDS
ncbi:MAG: M16 family metallopeptidase [Sphingobacteriaceae bacterium]